MLDPGTLERRIERYGRLQRLERLREAGSPTVTLDELRDRTTPRTLLFLRLRPHTATLHMRRRTPDMRQDTATEASLTVREVVAYLGVNERTIRRAIDRGALTASKESGLFRISLASLDRFQSRRLDPTSSDGNRSSPAERLSS